jgi:hypothetical protein
MSPSNRGARTLAWATTGVTIEQSIEEAYDTILVDAFACVRHPRRRSAAVVDHLSRPLTNFFMTAPASGSPSAGSHLRAEGDDHQ